jgi:hypothetical protein
VEVVGNGILNGFIWYEDMQVCYVPEPGGAVLLLAGLVLACRAARP